MDPTTPPAAPLARSRARPARAALWRWVPIRGLGPRHRARILEHLLALSERDRYLRFGYPASNERIEQYVQALDFQRDEVCGIFNRRLKLVAMAHIAYVDQIPGLESDRPMAEFAVSVAASARGRGYGGRLFAQAVVHARNRRFERLFIHALTENTPMLRIAQHAGARLVHEGSESEAWLQLPGDSVASHVEELISSHVAEVDYHWKRERMRLHRLGRFIADLRDHLRRHVGDHRKTASH